MDVKRVQRHGFKVSLCLKEDCSDMLAMTGIIIVLKIGNNIFYNFIITWGAKKTITTYKTEEYNSISLSERVVTVVATNFQQYCVFVFF